MFILRLQIARILNLSDFHSKIALAKVREAMMIISQKSRENRRNSPFADRYLNPWLITNNHSG